MKEKSIPRRINVAKVTVSFAKLHIATCIVDISDSDITHVCRIEFRFPFPLCKRQANLYRYFLCKMHYTLEITSEIDTTCEKSCHESSKSYHLFYEMKGFVIAKEKKNVQRYALSAWRLFQTNNTWRNNMLSFCLIV